MTTHTVLKMTEQIKAISEKWKALPDEERQPYLDRAATDKQRYLAEKEALATVCIYLCLYIHTCICCAGCTQRSG